MIEIREFSKEDVKGVVELWNKVFKHAYKSSVFTVEQFEKMTWENRHFDPESSFVSIRDRGGIIGFVISLAAREYENDSYWHTVIPGWIGAIAVHPDFRRSGIGKDLLHKAVTCHGKRGRELVFVGGGEGIHYLLPGIDTRWEDAISFFQSQGFSFVRRSCHINIDLTAFEPPSRLAKRRKDLQEQGIEIRPSSHEERESYQRFLKEIGAAGQEQKMKRWISSPEKTIIAVLNSSRIIGEVVHLGVNKQRGTAWYHDIYTLPEFRGKGIGTALLIEAMQECRKLGGQTMPLWTLPSIYEGFYAKIGFKVEVNWDVYAKRLDQDLLSREWIARYL